MMMRNKLIIGALIIAIVVAAGVYAAWQYSLPTPEITLKVLLCDYQQYYDPATNLAANYTLAHPNVHVEIELASFADAIPKTVSAAAAGTPYDLIMTASTANSWTLVTKGLVLPLTGLVNDLGTDHWLAGTLTKYQNEYWMVNAEFLGQVMYYRTDIFAEKGLTPPKTWAELKSTAALLTEDLDNDSDIDRYGWDMGLATDYFNGETSVLPPILMNGGHIIDAQGNLVFNSSQNIETMKFLKDLSQYCPPGIASASWSQLRTDIFEGRVAMSWYVNFYLPEMLTQYPQMEGKLGIAPMPSPDGNSSVSRLNMKPWQIGNGTKYESAAKDFLKWLMQPENIVILDLPGGGANLPCVTGVTDLDIWKNDSRIKKYATELETYLDVLSKYGQPVAIMENKGVFNPKTSVILSGFQLVNCAQDVIVNNMPAEEAVSKWYTEMAKALA